MSKDKITHLQARIDVAILNKTNAKLRLENVHEQRLNDYITQQEKLDEELTETMIIANSRLERLNGLELEHDKKEKLLELYKKLYNGCTDYHDYDELKEIQKQIKELENE